MVATGENNKWDGIFYYDESSPTYLRRSNAVWGGMGHKILQMSAGSVAGGMHKSDIAYSYVVFNGKTMVVHRVIWEIFNGDIAKGNIIDHLDGDRRNNNITNLRSITRKENSRNKKRVAHNATGVTGIRRHCTRGVNFYWAAGWRDIKGNSKTKYFSINKFGDDAAKTMAIDYRIAAIEQLNAAGAGYTLRHGT